MEGWIKLHRKLSENPLWHSEKFTRGQAWVDLILLANHEPGYFYLREHKIKVDRGQVGWSQTKLGKRWKWSRKKVKKFINDLEKEQQVKLSGNQSTSLITLLNYGKHQKKEPLGLQQKNNSSTTEEQQQHPNKNEKNDKERKEIYTHFFSFWNSQKILVHQKLNSDIENAIEFILENFNKEEIEKGIKNYSDVFNSPKTYFSHKWTLTEFLTKQNAFKVFLNKTVDDYLTKPKKKNSAKDMSKEECAEIEKKLLAKMEREKERRKVYA